MLSLFFGALSFYCYICCIYDHIFGNLHFYFSLLRSAFGIISQHY